MEGLHWPGGREGVWGGGDSTTATLLSMLCFDVQEQLDGERRSRELQRRGNRLAASEARLERELAAASAANGRLQMELDQARAAAAVAQQRMFACEHDWALRAREAEMDAARQRQEAAASAEARCARCPSLVQACRSRGVACWLPLALTWQRGTDCASLQGISFSM
jgi:hypothetical protein